MEEPRIIRITPLADPDIAEIEKNQIDELAYVIYKIKRLLFFPLSKRRDRLPKLINLSSVDDRGATYRNNIGFIFKHNAFFIVNYHPCYYLMPTDELSESSSREQSWQNIQHYHEHLLASLQDNNANRVSEWLAKEIFSKLHAQSFLELGCGAGRNLIYIHKNIPQAETTGLDINPEAISVAQEQLQGKPSKLSVASIYDLTGFADRSFDVVFTSGVLMHTPSDQIVHCIQEMNRIAKKAVVHFELDGPSHVFDYHRYPRDYGQIYHDLHFPSQVSYRKFPPDDFRSNMKPPFCHALLICRVK